MSLGTAWTADEEGISFAPFGTARALPRVLFVLGACFRITEVVPWRSGLYPVQAEQARMLHAPERLRFCRQLDSLLCFALELRASRCSSKSSASTVSSSLTEFFSTGDPQSDVLSNVLLSTATHQFHCEIMAPFKGRPPRDHVVIACVDKTARGLDVSATIVLDVLRAGTKIVQSLVPFFAFR